MTCVLIGLALAKDALLAVATAPVCMAPETCVLLRRRWSLETSRCTKGPPVQVSADHA